MLRRIPLLLLLAAASAIAAPPVDDAAQEKGFARIRQDAIAGRLLDQASEDVKAQRYAAALEKALAVEKMRPNDPIVLNTKGAALVELHRFDEAATTLAAAIEAAPDAFAPQFNQGELLSLQKKYSDAAVQFAILKSRFGPMPRIKYNLYLSYALAGQKDLASQNLLLMRYPDDGVAWYYAYAADYLLSGRKREARRLMAAADAIQPDETNTYRDTLREAGLLK